MIYKNEDHSTLTAAAATAAKSLQSCTTLCDPIDGSPPGSPVPEILQARTLEWVAISFSNAWQWKSESEVAQSCLTLSDPMDCSLPGSSVHGIFQARVLEWGAIAFSMDYKNFKHTQTHRVNCVRRCICWAIIPWCLWASSHHNVDLKYTKTVSVSDSLVKLGF